MPWSKPTSFTAWSFSRLSAYRQCPLKAKLSNLDKIAEPKSPAMERGTAIHKLAEDYISGVGRTVPKELKVFASELKLLRARRKSEAVFVEEMWVFRRDWTETRWDDWDGAWLRVKVDVCDLSDPFVTMTDWKTGKYSPQWNLDDYVEQMDLYATAGLVKYAFIGPGLKITPLLRFTDAGVTHPPAGQEKVYTPNMLPALKKKWEAAAKPLLSDREFAPKPNKFCYSCHYRKDNAANGGGQCQY